MLKKSYKFSFIFLLFMIQVVYATPLITAKVDRDNINMGETFNYVISVDEQIKNTPDFSPLTRHFEIVQQAQTKQMSIVNGIVKAKMVWIVQLEAKKAGKLTIPSIQVGNLKTQPLTITVAANTTTVSDENTNSNEVFVKASVSNKNPYVQSQLIYTVKIFALENLVNNWQTAQLTPPSLENAIVSQIGSVARYDRVVKGQNYQVSEIRYAIFPQKSGQFSITPASFHGQLLTMLDDDPFNNQSPFYSTGVKRYDAVAPNLSVNVKPIASDFKGSTWLPAQKVTLEETWSHDLNQAKVGQPITRTITTTAVGITAAQLPNLNFKNSNEINSYPDKAVISNSVMDGNVVGKRVDKIAYVPTKAGTIILPTISLAWWNVVNNKMEVATLPAQTLTIEATSNDTAKDVITTPTDQTTQSRGNTQLQEDVPAVKNYNYLPWLLVSFLGLLWLITIFYMRARKKTTPKQTKNIQKNASLPSAITAVKKACEANDFVMLKTALLNWAKTQFKNQEILSLGQVSELIADEHLQQTISNLDAALYANKNVAWDGKIFWEKFIDYAKKKHDRKNNKENDLPSLYLE